MKRLTKKNEFNDYIGSNLLDDEALCRNNLNFEELNEQTEMINKLGKLEDLEEEFNIDLILVLTAIKDGFYVNFRNEIDNVNVYNGFIFNFKAKQFEVDIYRQGTGTIGFAYDDYKKTWALKKESLE